MKRAYLGSIILMCLTLVLCCSNPFSGSSANPAAPAVPDQRVAVFSSGYYVSAAVMNDGSLWTWGKNEYGLLGTAQATHILAYYPSRVGNAKDWASVSVGHANVLALKTDGSLYAWGMANYGAIGDGASGTMRDQPVRVGSDTDWQYIHAAYLCSFAIKNDGRLFAWGRNGNATLGDGTKTNRLVPVQIGDGLWKQLSSNEEHTIGIQQDGSLWSWGLNTYGALGLGTSISESLSPSRVGSDNDWSKIMVTASYSLGLKSDGSLWAWGYNNGQLGLGAPSTPVYTPTQVGTDMDWQTISAANTHVLAIKQNGDLYSWGSNSYGQLGRGRSSASAFTPALLDDQADWTQVFALGENSFARRSDGSWYAWGLNERAQFGNGCTNQRIAPRIIVPASTRAFSAVTCSSNFNNRYLAIASDGTLWAWGDNSSGALGVGDTSHRYQVTQVGSASNWRSLSAGVMGTFAINSAGELYAWGENSQGYLGLGGPYEDKYQPTRLGTANNWQLIASGGTHTLGLQNDGSLWVWGTENYGALGNGTNGQISTPERLGSQTGWTWIAASSDSSYAIQNGALYAWGNNNSGQLGDNSTTNRDSPVRVGNDSDWVKVLCAESSAVGIRSDGSLWMWGSGYFGNGTTSASLVPIRIGTASNWTSVSRSSGGGGAISAGGTLWTWGGYESGHENTTVILSMTQLGPEKGWQSISMSPTNAAAIDKDGNLWSWGGNTNGAAAYDSFLPIELPWKGATP